MSELYQSLSDSKWGCEYPVVFVPKRRRNAKPIPLLCLRIVPNGRKCRSPSSQTEG
jgi:hypothetical protein